MGNTAINVTNYDSLGYVRVTWDNSDESPGWEAWRVYRRDNDVAGPWTLVQEVTVAAANYTVDDYLAPANRDLDYAVVEVTTGNVEGSYTPVAASPVGTNYWLVDDTDTNLTLRLEHVTDDSFDEEYEEDTILLIGRGRKKDIGTRWGFAGSINAMIRTKNGKSALDQYTELKAIRAANNVCYLRSPFGDVFKIALSGLDFDRIPETGTDLALEVSFDYEEIA